MALQPKNWPLNTYTAATWTDLIAEVATVSVLFAHNTTAGPAVVQVQLLDGVNGFITHNVTLTAGETQAIDVRGMVTTGTQSIQVQADVVGVNFVACGTVQAA